MIRLPHWQSALNDYLLKCYSTPFKYGLLDCGLFVAGAIHAMTGVDVAASLRGRYSNRVEAFAAIKALCGNASMDAVANHLAREHGIKEVPVLCAQRGDPVVLKQGRASTLGIVAMHGTDVLMPYKDGILRLPINKANITRAFHI